MRKRIKIWQDSLALDDDFGTWDPNVYAELPVLEGAHGSSLWYRYEEALAAFKAVRTEILNRLEFNVPLNADEFALLEREKAELEALNGQGLLDNEQ